MESRKSEPTNINDLNAVCLDAIFDYIDLIPRLKLRQVCKRWRTVIDDWWQSIDTITANGLQTPHRCKYSKNDFELMVNDNKKFTNTIAMLHQCGQSLRCIKIDLPSLTYPDVLITTAQKCHNLTEITVGVDTLSLASYVQDIFQSNQNLQSICLYLDEEICYPVLQAMPLTLKKLNIYCLFYSEIGFNTFNPELINVVCQKIRECSSLIVYSSHIMTDEILECLGEKRDLTCLYFPSVQAQFVTSSGMRNIFKMHQLTELYVEFDYRCTTEIINDEFIKQITSSCKLLENLTIAGSRLNVTDESISYIRTLRHLRSLELCNIQHITDGSISTFTYLLDLTLSYCKQVKDPGVIKLLKVTNQLETIALDGTGITDLTIICADEYVRRRRNAKRLVMTVSSDVYTEKLTDPSTLLKIETLERKRRWDGHTDFF